MSKTRRFTKHQSSKKDRFWKNNQFQKHLKKDLQVKKKDTLLKFATGRVS